MPNDIDRRFSQATDLGMTQNHLNMSQEFKQACDDTSIEMEPTPDTDEDKPVCRICLDYDFKDNLNPMLAPCKCTGTMRYIHFECLRQWLISKRETHYSYHV